MYKQLKDRMDYHSKLIDSIAQRLIAGAEMTGREIFHQYKNENDVCFAFCIGFRDGKWGLYHCVGTLSYYPTHTEWEECSEHKSWSQQTKIEFVNCLDEFLVILGENNKAKLQAINESITKATSFVSEMEFKSGTFEEIPLQGSNAKVKRHISSITLSSAQYLHEESPNISIHCDILLGCYGNYIFSLQKMFAGEEIGEKCVYITTSNMDLPWLRSFLLRVMEYQLTMYPKTPIDKSLIESFDTFDGS